MTMTPDPTTASNRPARAGGSRRPSTVFDLVRTRCFPWLTHLWVQFIAAVAVIAGLWVFDLQPAVAGEGTAEAAAAIDVMPGFEMERVYTVPRQRKGSWVSMTVDDRGRLIVSDQEDAGLYRVTPPPPGGTDETVVEPIDLPISGAQGLSHAFDSLYVVVNGDSAEGSGLYRLRDTSGDDRFDDMQLLRAFDGSGEHGPHAVIPGPDGASLYVLAGDMTGLPEPEKTLLPRGWDVDRLLPQMRHPGMFASVEPPGGWIARTDPEGERFELFAAGIRNPYDMAFDHHGELFTFDADAEGDLGAPWYRPIRIKHMVSGADFGWRAGTRTWPDYYADSLPAVLELGLGSPTAVVFGYGTRFPAKYQRAMFVADWSFGRLYAIHLEPDGATYTAGYEQIAAASPLPITAVAVHPEHGALYVLTGGRGTQSHVYRLVYAGEDATDPVGFERPPEDAAADRRRLRRSLEAYHGDADAGVEAIDAAWPYLGHADRYIRYAARIAIEHQAPSLWQERALLGEHANASAAITALIALARAAGQADDADDALLGRIVERLNAIDYGSLEPAERLAWLRAYQLVFIRLGEPDDRVRGAAVAKLDPLYPAGAAAENHELSQLMLYLGAEGAIGRTLDLLEAAASQEEQVHYAFVLGMAGSGWSMEQRRRYFRWHRETELSGGSARGQMQRVREQVIEQLDEPTTDALADLLDAPDAPAGPAAPEEARQHVRHWSVEEVVEAVGGRLHGRDFDRGRRTFATARCFDCHRFVGEGRAVGPDLTALAGRFSKRDLATKLVEPNRNVSDQYRNTIFTLDDGTQVVGQVSDLREQQLRIMTNPFAPTDFTDVPRDRIVSAEPSPISPMMPGLLNTLNAEELRDLFAFILSRGDPEHAAFKEAK